MKAAATKELFGYWNRLRGARAAPERSDVDPVAIRGALGDVFILEVDATYGFPFRLSGSRICAILSSRTRTGARTRRRRAPARRRTSGSPASS